MSAFPSLQADWPAPGNVRTLFTCRSQPDAAMDPRGFNLGLTVGEDREQVMARRRLLEAGVGYPLTWIGQVHGTSVARLGAQPEGAILSPADAVWTAAPGRPCMMLVADCLPVFLCRRDGSAVGVAHAGWRGLASGVLEAAVEAMQAGQPEGGRGLLAWLGPCIGPAHFEVGAEVREAFVSRDAGAGLAFRRRADGKYLCDLPALARRRLAAAGVTAAYGGRYCTYAHPERFFSHRRTSHHGDPAGRMAALIWMCPPATGPQA